MVELDYRSAQIAWCGVMMVSSGVVVRLNRAAVEAASPQEPYEEMLLGKDGADYRTWSLKFSALNGGGSGKGGFLGTVPHHPPSNSFGGNG